MLQKATGYESGANADQGGQGPSWADCGLGNIIHTAGWLQRNDGYKSEVFKASSSMLSEAAEARQHVGRVVLE